MEGDELEMSKEELHMWIREKVEKNKLISKAVQDKCNLLQSLLGRREKQAAHLLKLCESVAACEAIVRKQYALLGWEYRDTDSDSDDEDKTSSGNSAPSPCEVVRTGTQAPTANGSTHRLPKLEDNALYKSFTKLKREPVVVLTRLPVSKISSLCPQKPAKHLGGDESSSCSDSDMQWEPNEDSSDSDYSVSSYNSGPNKRRKRGQKTETLAKSPRASANTDAKSNTTETSTPPASIKTDAKSSATTASVNTDAKSNATTTSTPETNGNTNAKSIAVKTSAKNTNATPSSVRSTLSGSYEETSKTPPRVPQGEVSVNMTVLARRRAMSWQNGTIKDIITKEDGKLKYKISLEGKGKILVSGHHIAFNNSAKLEQLYVGARVVVQCDAEKPQFCPGILAELPSRKNHMRFLVFTDDKMPIYVALPAVHLVCRPLMDPLDDIKDDTHKNFMKEYIKMWPYPPQTQYRVGQIIRAEFEGEQQKCEVLVMDCSLIQVVFESDKHKEWIYRGSLRLEHMINMNKLLKKDEMKFKIVNDSSKSPQ